MAVSLRDIGFRLGYDLDKQSEAAVENSISSLKSMATKMLGAIGIGFSLTQINALTEEFRTVNRAIESTVAGLGDVEEAEQSILEAANDSRITYESMADTVANLVKSDSELFPVQDAVDFASAVTQLLKTSGRSDQQVQNLLTGLNKSFQKGIVDTETLNIMLEQCPEAANLLANSLGVAKTSLLDMATNGQISCQQLKDAFLNSADEIGLAFDDMDLSVSEALKNVRNSWGVMLAEFDETFGITDTIARTIVKLSNAALSAIQKVKTRLQWLADKLGGANKLIKLIAVTAGAVYAALNAQKILTFLKSAISLLTAVRMRTLAIVAIVVILALLVEDFVAFMKGENSLLGAILEKAGVDTEKFRQNIIKIWNNLKQVLTAIWQGIKNVAIPVFESIWAGVKKVFQAIGKIIDWIAPKFADLIDQLANGNVDVEGWQRFGEVLATVGAAILGIVAVVKIIRTAMAAWAVVQTIVNSALLACPVTWIVAAIIALIAIIGLLVKNWDDVKAAVQAVWDKIVDVFSTIADWFKTNVIDPIANFFTDLWTSITTTVGNIKESIVTGLTEAIDWIKSLPEQAIQWGKDIIMGIVNGIKSAISAVSEAVQEVASTIKSYVGFSEPDEGPLSNFHTYMPDMIDLMSKGINAGKDKIVDAMSGLTGDMSLIARSNVVADSTAAGVTNNSTVSKRISQNVNISNTFNGDRAGQAKSATAMSSASDDAISTMARALAFAR